MSKDQQIEGLRAENQALRQELDQLKRLIFGSKSERFVPDQNDSSQLNIFGDLVEATEPTIKQEISYQRSNAKKHPGRSAIPDHLPVEEIILEPEDKSEGMVKIGEEISETVEYTPASLIKKRVIRPKYAHPSTQQVLIADLPDRSMPKCMAEPSLIAFLLNRKFVEHMPFYRQIAQIERDYKWTIASSTVGNWFIQACDLLEPLYDRLREELLKASYLQADESPIKVLDKDKLRATHQGYQWVYHAPELGLVLFDYRKGRGKAGPEKILKDYTGIIQCDGWQVYDKIAKDNPNIRLAGCLAHVRRKFYEAQKQDATKADYALSKIKEIYLLEREAKKATDKQSYRLEKMLPLVKELREWIDQQAIAVTPKSSIGKAMTYFINQYPKLLAIFEDSRVELDNNRIENKIRPLALGRKNYLFAGSHPAAQRIAMMYSFFASCQANEINPHQWIKKTLETIHLAKTSELNHYLPNKEIM